MAKKIKFKPLHEPHEPIPGDIEARLTKPKEDNLYQVFVEVRGLRHPIPVGPKTKLELCEEIAVAIRGMIALGKEKTWGNPHVVLCT
jgi:hypothetical protein